jgi:hypothetical protein
MPTVQFRVWAKNAGVGVSQWAVETFGIWQQKGGSTTQQIDTKVRMCVWQIAHSITMINMQGSGPEHWCLPINCSITRIGDLDSGRPHWKLYMADKTNLDRQKLQAALHGSEEFDFCGREYRIEKTPTWKRK